MLLRLLVRELRHDQIQRYKGGPLSLISNFSTTICVYTASKIPPPPKSADVALQLITKPAKQRPKTKDSEYVSYLYHHIDKDNAPDDEEFHARAQASLNVKTKFSQLQDVRDGQFCDVIAQVARDPYDAGDKTTFYVSDYTENKQFFHYTYEGVFDLPSADGAAFGHNPSSSASKQWHGPYGKRAIQITAYEPHASFIRSAVAATQWVLIKNLQIKHGRDGNNLEGFLREDRSATGERLNIIVLETQGDPESIDPRLKDAVRRLREYKKQCKEELRKLEQATGVKRKAEDERDSEDLDRATKVNSKARRKLKRREAERKNEVELNKLVACESHGNEVSTIPQILEPSFYDTTLDGQSVKLPMPFTCAKYLANVRVVDFRPNRLEEFAVGRKRGDYEILSDNSSSSSEDEEDRVNGIMGGRKHVWEWRFCLQLEDARPRKESKKVQLERLWVVVDNAQGQCLTDLDASDLKNNRKALDKLRERMFTLWGDLEEHKSRDLEEMGREKGRRPGDRPALDSDGEEDSGKGERFVSNTPFACCIRQYGVSVSEKDPKLADAGDGKRWERVFGLFGTKISS